MQKHSIKILLEWIPKILATFCCLLLLWVGYHIFKADLDFIKTRVFESHEALLGELEQKIYEDLEGIGTEVMSIAKVEETSSLRWLELNQDEVIQNLTRKILSPSEWKSLQQGKIPKPIILRVYRFQAPSFVKTVNRLEKLFDGRQRRLAHSSKDIHPVLNRIGKQNIVLHSDYETQKMGLTLNDWNNLSKLSEKSDVPFLGEITPAFLHPIFMEGLPAEGISPISRQLFLSTEDHITSRYPIPPYEEKFLGQHRVLEEQIDDNEEMPLLWITGYLFSRLSRFGPNLHPLHKMLEANPEFQPLEARGKLFSMFNVSIGWEIFPLDFMTSPNQEIIPILPERILAVMINQPRLIRSLLPPHLDNARTEYRQIWYQFPDQNSEAPLPEDIDSLAINNNLPLQFMLDLKDREHLCTSIRSHSLAKSRIQICESLEPRVFGKNQSPSELGFSNKWRVILLLILAAIFLAYKPLKSWGNQLNLILNSCIESLIGNESYQVTRNTPWEFVQLNKSIFDLKSTVNLRNLDFALALGIQEILNQPGKKLWEYAEDMEYFLKENTNTLKWKLQLSPDQSLAIVFPDSVADSTKALLEELALAARSKSELEAQALELVKIEKEMALAEVLRRGLLPDTTQGEGLHLAWNYRHLPNLSICTQIILIVINTSTCIRICLLEIPRPNLGTALMASALKARIQAILSLLQPFSFKEIPQQLDLMAGFFIETGQAYQSYGTEPFAISETNQTIHVKSNHQNFDLEISVR
ncbi:MAG: hypothetical protein H3C47_12900 [Candidatus Cloacimonetes bacterium]|nr:hypothetical protein [Candidatus Cloacimonadota bacterium]